MSVIAFGQTTRDLVQVPVSLKRYFKPVTHAQVDSAGWQISRISWPAWYYDYGGPANVEFWARVVRGRDVVIVFMFAPGSDEQLRDRAKIVASVRE